MTEPFRYFDEQRKFDESLRDIEVPAPEVPELLHGGLERIARGDTAFAKLASGEAAARATVPQDLQKAELKQKLKALLEKDQKRKLMANTKLSSFIARAEKIANPTGPDITPGVTMSGSGESENREATDRRRHCSHQGPAGDFFAAGLKELRQQEQAHKTAASRLDKEVARGRLEYKDVYPEIREAHPADHKELARKIESSPGRVGLKQLKRRRALNAAIDNNTRLRGQSEGVKVVPRNLPGQGPMNIGVGKRQLIFAGKDSGQRLRGFVRGADRKPKRKAVDATLGRAATAHEVAEAQTARGKRFHTHATHHGVKPIIQENLATHGDPGAQRVFRKLRHQNHDDRLVAKAMKQVGAHPDRPLAAGGKQQRAVERILERKKDNLSRPGKMRALGRQIVEDIAGRGARVHTAPSSAAAASKEYGSSLRGMWNAARSKAPLRKKLKDVASHYARSSGASRAITTIAAGLK